MMRRYGACVIATFLTYACDNQKTGFTMAAPPEGVTRVAPKFGLSSDLVISDIQIVDLGTLPGGTNSSAYDINDAGDIVGSSETTSGQTHGFILIGSVKTDLGTLPGGDVSSAFGINNLRQVVGTANTTPSVFLVSHGFMWQSGVMRDLGAFPPEDALGSQSFATAINDAGLIAGTIHNDGVVWNLAGVPTFPPFPPAVRVTDLGESVTNDINNAGQAAVWFPITMRAFRWQSGTLTMLPPPPPPAGPDVVAFGINGLGAVVGIGVVPP